MAKNLSPIDFNFAIDNSPLIVQLQADVQIDDLERYYIVTNFRKKKHDQLKVASLPDLKIHHNKGIWVHIDTGMPSALSEAAGKAIEGLNVPLLIEVDINPDEDFD